MSLDGSTESSDLPIRPLNVRVYYAQDDMGGGRRGSLGVERLFFKRHGRPQESAAITRQCTYSQDATLRRCPACLWDSARWERELLEKQPAGHATMHLFPRCNSASVPSM